jgi:hypothetical protein
VSDIVVSDKLYTEAKRYKLEPNSTPQSTFLALPDDIFEAGYGGTAGTGKTFALVTLPLFYKCHEIRGFYGKIWRRSFPQIQESLEPESNKWYPQFGYTYNSQDHVWTNKRTKSQIAFGFLERDADALKHDSAQYHYLGFEECTQFTKFMYTYLLHRCRSDIAGWTAICRNDATPGDIGNTWYRRHFVEPAPEGYKVIEGQFNNKIVKRMFIRAHKEDNVNLLQEDPTYYDRLEMLPEALRKAKLYGDFWAFQGQVFEEFRTFHMEGEPDHAVHVFDPSTDPRFRFINGEWLPPDWWPKIIVIDWGYRHGNYVGWGAVSPEKRLYVYRDYLTHFTKIKVWGAEAKRMSQFDGNIVKIICDPSAWGDRGEDQTLKDQIESATGWNLEKADNDRIGGKQLIHELLRWTERPKKFEQKQGFDQDYAQKLLRIKGLEAYQVYVNQFLADNTSELLPKVKIATTCNPTIEAIQACIYDEGTGNNRQQAEDVKKVDGDDPYDGFRYMSKAWEAFTEQANQEWIRRCEYEEAMEAFRKSGDYMAYDNKMSFLENANKIVPMRTKANKIRKHGRVRLH